MTQLPAFFSLKKLFSCLLLLSLLSLSFFSQQALAQSVSPISSGIATMVDINDKNVGEGDIITFTGQGYQKSSIAYDPHIFGVVTTNPQVVLENAHSKNAYAVISVGKVYVNVTTAKGSIKSGDPITTSGTPGVGEKAAESGYVIGTAAEAYTASDHTKVGKILVILNIGFNTRPTTISSNLIQSLKLALASPEVSPVAALRYFLAAAVVIISLIFGIGFFGRVSATGVEAIGRNPLASRLIMVSMVFHLGLALAIILIGIAISYLILVL